MERKKGGRKEKKKEKEKKGRKGERKEERKKRKRGRKKKGPNIYGLPNMHLAFHTIRSQLCVFLLTVDVYSRSTGGRVLKTC